MKRQLLALALSTLCLAGCETARVAVPVHPPADRMDCVALTPADRPRLPPEHVIDWSAVVTVPQARSEHEAYVRSVRTREGVTVAYIVTVEGRQFACANDAAWLRDFFKRLPQGQG